MKKFFWIFAFVLFFSGFFLIYKFAVKPRPAKLIKLSEVEAPRDVARMIWHRLRQEFRKESLWVFGIQDANPYHAKVVSEFINLVGEEDRPIENVIRVHRMDLTSLEDAGRWGSLNTTSQLPIWRQQAAKFISSGQRSLFIWPSVYTTTLTGPTPLNSIEKAVKKRLMRVSFVGLALKMEDLKRIRPACSGQGTFQRGTPESLGCAMKAEAVATFRKKPDENKFVFTMKSFGRKDYMVFLHTPR